MITILASSAKFDNYIWKLQGKICHIFGIFKENNFKIQYTDNLSYSSNTKSLFDFRITYIFL